MDVSIHFCEYDQISATFFAKNSFRKGELNRPEAQAGLNTGNEWVTGASVDTAGSRRSWEPNDVRVARDVPYRGNSDGEILPNGIGQGYFAMGAAFIAVGVGSAGAAVLAMSLLASDLPNPAPEREIIESAMASEAQQALAKSEEPIFKELIPSAVTPTQAGAVALGVPATRSVAADPDKLSALTVGDPRFAHDASAARGLEDVGPEKVESAYVPMKRPMRTPFDDIKDPPLKDDAAIETAAVAPPPKPKAEPEKAVGSGNAPAASAIMIDGANLRAKPQKGSKVLGTVPSRSAVQVISCSSWCEIVYKGKRGYVWGDFVQRGQGRTKVKIDVKAAAPGSVEKPAIVRASSAPVPHKDDKSR